MPEYQTLLHPPFSTPSLSLPNPGLFCVVGSGPSVAKPLPPTPLANLCFLDVSVLLMWLAS